MNKKEEEFLQRLRETFRIEAEEHLRTLTAGLIELEKSPLPEHAAALIETMFREAHSLKGAARSVSINEVESICHGIESIFGKIKNSQVSLRNEHFDILQSTFDTVASLVSGKAAMSSNNLRKILLQLRAIANQDEEKTSNTGFVPEPITPSVDGTPSVEKNEKVSGTVLENVSGSATVRIPAAKLDPLFLQAEEMIQSKITIAERYAELTTILESIGQWQSELRVWNDRRFSQKGLTAQEILVRSTEKLDELGKNISNVAHLLEVDQRSLGWMINDHLESIKNVLMLPVSTLVEGFPKFVRDLSRSEGKEVELIIHGREIEVDKRILEELKDPLNHLIRNCIDHGVRKPDRGTITLSFDTIENRKLEVTISDNGAGIDIAEVRTAAVKAGVLTNEALEHLSIDETMAVIFESGVSTTPIVTDISGRGLGLAIVREKTEKLNGSVTVKSIPNSGTTFTMVVPLSLATMRGILVNVGKQRFAIPALDVERTIRVQQKDIKTVEHKDTIFFDGAILPIVSLGNLIGIGKSSLSLSSKSIDAETHSNVHHVVILIHGNKRIAVTVDEIVEENQMLVKDLGKQLRRVRHFSGATVLGSGAVVPVIFVPDVIKTAVRTVVPISTSDVREAVMMKKYRILVTDDSITSRTLIRNIVETAGYEVETAVDGVDALTKVVAGDFDLIISDVDMPRMNGFELTTKIRKDKKISETPVILVTALESRDDLERGIDAGASAYIVKSSFDQSNLLEVIKKFL